MNMTGTVKFHHSILTKLTALNALLFVAVGGIIAVTLFSFQNIKQGMTTVIGTEVADVIKNAGLGRELSVVFADANMLVGTFVENDALLQREGDRLLKMFERNLSATGQRENTLAVSLQQYRGGLQSLLEQCAVVNAVIKEMRSVDLSIKQTLDALDKKLAERLLEGSQDELATLDNLGAMLSGYREIQFNIIILADAMIKAHLGVDDVARDYEQELLSLCDELNANLEVVNISGRQFTAFGAQLTAAVQQYATQIAALRQSLQTFQERLRTLKTDQEQVKTAMETLDRETAASTVNIQQDIDRTIRSSVTMSIVAAIIIFAILLFTGYLSLRMLRPIKNLADMAAQLARGDLTDTNTMLTARSQDEIGVLQRTMGHTMRTIHAVLNETSPLIQAVRDGKLDARGRSDGFEGSWQELIDGVNHVIDAVAAPINVTAGHLERLAKGDIPDKIEAEYHGDFNAMKNNLNGLIDATSNTVRIAEAIAEGNLAVDAAERSEGDRLMQAMNQMIRRLNVILDTTNDIIRAVQKGELKTRGSSGQFEGSWHDLIEGVNRIIEAFVRPINVTATYLDQIAKGEIPEQITDPYHGDFNEMKNNLNMLIDAMEHATRVAETIASGAVMDNVRERSEADRLMRALNRLIDATNATTRVAEEIAKGNVAIEVQERSEDDRMMQALNAMIVSLKEVSNVAEAISSGNLTVEVKKRSEQDSLMRSLEAMVATLNRIVVDVKTAAATVAAGSSDISTIAEQMSQGTSQQAAATEQVSSSMEEMAANIRQTADNAKITDSIAVDSAGDAQMGGEAVTKTIEAMKTIADRISVIQEIAMQTHLLSLNATIEAAKAQDYGKGFAVVASEVRNLAQRSREAAEEIEQLVVTCVNVSERAGTILQRLVPNSKKTAELVQEINSASNEQSTGAEHINAAIQQLDQVVQQNAATAEEMASSAETLTAQAKQLQQAVAFFVVRQTTPAQTTSEPDLASALRTLLAAKGSDPQTLTALLSTILTPSAPAAEPQKADAPIQPHPKAVQAYQNHAAQKIGSKIDQCPKITIFEEKGGKDELDNEFERY